VALRLYAPKLFMNCLFAPTASARLRFGKHALALSTALLCWLTPHRASAAVPDVATSKPTAEAEFAALQARGERARLDMSRWLLETDAHDNHLAEKAPNLLSRRMERRLVTVSAGYREFIGRYPLHAGAADQLKVFCDNITEDLGTIRRWEEARAENPDCPVPWNDLANDLAHNGRILDAFACFEKTLSFASDEAVYHFDYATALLLYRGNAMSHYKLTERELFDRVLLLYRQGMKLAPQSYPLAADFARTYYVVRPARPAAGLAAWENAFKLATYDPQRDEARIHLARYAIHAGHLNLARIHLEPVTETGLEPVKLSLLRRIDDSGKARNAALTPAPGKR